MRPGLVVGITIPLVLAVTFLAMNYFGIGLHKISLGSLIIALGLLVDDAIIAVEMMVRKMEEGYDKVRAATFAYEVDGMPMLTGTLITAAGFLPIGMAKSVVGEYTFAIFAVTVHRAGDLRGCVSVYFVPYLGTLLLKVKPHEPGRAAARALRHAVLQRASAALVDWCVEHRWITIGATVLSLRARHRRHGRRCSSSSSPIRAGRRSWSTSGFPEGTSFAANEEVDEARRGSGCAGADGVSHRHAPGSARASPRFYLPLDQVFPQTNVSQLIVLPQGPEGARVAAREAAGAAGAGVPRGARPRQAAAQRAAGAVSGAVPRRRHRSRRSCARCADEVKADDARPTRTLRGVNDNWNESVKVLRLEVDQAKARALGVTSQAIAQASRTILGGSNVGQFREGDKLIDIVLRQPLDERKRDHRPRQRLPADGVGQSRSRSTQIAKPVFAWEPGVMWRESRDYAITVQGDIVEGLQGATVTAQLAARSSRRCDAKMAARLPDRGGRRGGGEQQGSGLDRGRRADHAVHHVHAADAAAAQLQPGDAGVPHRRRSASPAWRRALAAARAGPSASSRCSA